MNKKYKYQQQQQSPAYHFKVSIRQRQRQEIRRLIINQYNDLDKLQLSINAVHSIVIIHFQKLFPQINYHCQKNEQPSIVPFFQEFSQKYESEDALGWRVRKMSQSISDINYYLNFQVNESNLQQLLVRQQHNGMEKNKSIKQSMKNLVKTCIPYIFFLIDKFEEGEELGDKKGKLKEELETINCRKIKEECLQILNRLSYFKQLNPFYTFYTFRQTENLTNHDESSSLVKKVQEWVHQSCQQYEGIKLICQNLINFISPDTNFYGSLISIGNFLSVANSKRQQNRRNSNSNEYIYQLLCDNQIQDIIAGKFCSFNQFMLDAESFYHQTIAQQHNRTDYQSLCEESIIHNHQEAILWFTVTYTKFLYVNQFPIYQNLLFRRYLYTYIINKLTKIRRSGEGNQKMGSICASDRNSIKKITQLLSYVGLELDNIFIINTLIPLIRQNWRLLEIASLWRYLTFTSQYQIIDLLHLSNIQDRITVKNNQSPIKDDQEQYENQGTASIQYVNSSSRLSSMFEIFIEIFETIAETGYFKQIKKRDKGLLDGMYNILLDMQIEQAEQLWNMVYADNEGIQCRLDSFLFIQQFVNKVESYFGCSRGLIKI